VAYQYGFFDYSKRPNPCKNAGVAESMNDSVKKLQLKEVPNGLGKIVICIRVESYEISHDTDPHESN